MRVLYLVPYAPTPIRTRPYNLIRGLTRRGHEVTLATLWESEEERAALGRLEREGVRVIAARLTRGRAFWNLLRALPTGEPLQAHYCWNPSLARALGFEIRDSRFDVIHVEHLRGARYGLYIKSKMPETAGHAVRNPKPVLSPVEVSEIPVVWDAVDCISYLFEQAARDSRSLQGRLMTRLELARTRRYEAWLVGQFDRVLVTSPTDKAALEQLEAAYGSPSPGRRGGRGGEVSVLPNGVDLAYFCPDDTPRDPATVVFSGKMSYRNVEVTGTVPDIRPYLRRATLAVVPLVYGAGSQFKVLEAMACATPVVATPQASSALQIQAGEQLLVAEDAETFAKSILRLSNDPDLQHRLGAAGRHYVERQHDWKTIGQQLEFIYRNAIELKKGGNG